MTMTKVMIMTMIMVNIHTAKARLSEYLEAAARGERVLICNRNRPVAELRAVAAARAEPRPVGGARGRLSVPPAFFEPLPDEVVGSFYASTETPEASRVAESSGQYNAEPPTARGSRSKGRR